MEGLKNVLFKGRRIESRDYVIGRLERTNLADPEDIKAQPFYMMSLINNDGSFIVDMDSIELHEEEVDDNDRILYKRMNAMYTSLSEKMKISEQEVRDLIPWMDSKVLDALDNSFLEKHDNEGLCWVAINSDVLEAVKNIMHPDWNEQYSDVSRYCKAQEEAEEGVTFAFYWKENRLCWER